MPNPCPLSWDDLRLQVTPGDGVVARSAAALLVVPVVQVELEIVGDFNASERGAGGFGHSGQN